MNTITLANTSFIYEIAYQKRRKTIGLKVLSTTHLKIVAPDKYPHHKIIEIIYAKSHWILQQISRLERLNACPLNKSAASGAKILFLGEPHQIVWGSSSQEKEVSINCKEQRIYLPLVAQAGSDKLAEAYLYLQQWLWGEAKKILSAKTLFWADKMKIGPKRITLKDQKTRWGSCSSLGNINYNWRIIMAPPEVIDYLVIHEIAHLRFPNHSKNFWQEVETFSPKWRECRSWLKHHGSLLIDFGKNLIF